MKAVKSNNHNYDMMVSIDENATIKEVQKMKGLLEGLGFYDVFVTRDYIYYNEESWDAEDSEAEAEYFRKADEAATNFAYDLDNPYSEAHLDF